MIKLFVFCDHQDLLIAVLAQMTMSIRTLTSFVRKFNLENCFEIFGNKPVEEYLLKMNHFQKFFIKYLSLQRMPRMLSFFSGSFWFIFCGNIWHWDHFQFQFQFLFLFHSRSRSLVSPQKLNLLGQLRQEKFWFNPRKEKKLTENKRKEKRKKELKKNFQVEKWL